MGPDISDGKIVEIDKTLGRAYIQDSYEDTVFNFDISNFAGRNELKVGSEVEYYKLYLELPTAQVVRFKKDEEQEEYNAIIIEDKKANIFSRWKQTIYDHKFEFYFYVFCVILGMIIGYFDDS